MTRFLTFALLILTACLLCVDTTSRLSLHCLTAPLLTSLVVSWPTAYLPRYYRQIVQILLGELILSICVVDVYCQEVFQTSITPQILSNLFLSDAREKGEFITSFIGFHILTHWRTMVILLLMVILPISSLYTFQMSEGIMRIRKAWIGVLGLCILYELPPSYKFAQLFFQNDDVQALEGLIFRHHHEEVLTPLHRLAFAWFSLKQSHHSLEGIKNSTYSAQVAGCTHLSPHIVLIIGESYNKHHSTLYGYQLPTTPLQQSRMDNGEIFVFDDVVTPWNITSNVFLDLFSTCSQGDTSRVESQPLLPVLFRRAGYSVNYFSNQYLLRGFRKGATNQAGHFFLADRALSDSLFSYRNIKSSKYDMGLVRQVAKYKVAEEDSLLTLDIIHLIGQHFDYSLRYPCELAQFTAKDYASRAISKEACKTIMHYDNATLYNDMVLDSILNIYGDQEAVIIFVADHGEEVYDNTPTHGRLFCQPTKEIAHQEFEVPMWIWCSKKYSERHSSLVKTINENKYKAFMTSDISHLLLHLAGINCKWYSKERDILSDDYKIKQRMIAGSFNYDE